MILRGKQWYRDTRGYTLPTDVNPAAYEHVEFIQEGSKSNIQYSYHIDLDKQNGIGRGLFPHGLFSFDEFKTLSMAGLEMALWITWNAMSHRLLDNDLLRLCQSCAVKTAEGKDTIAFTKPWKSTHDEQQAFAAYESWDSTSVKAYQEVEKKRMDLLLRFEYCIQKKRKKKNTKNKKNWNI